MHVGDIDSDAIGSGARANGEKPQLDLIPVRYWMHVWFAYTPLEETVATQYTPWYTGLAALRDFQEGDDEAIERWFKSSHPFPLSFFTVPVMEYGAKKYKEWNWAKGMPWSVPTGCALRHARAYIEDLEHEDPESGCDHFGHFQSNLMMLDWFRFVYPEGDNRPPRRENT
jgi:hypothetical protein